MYETDEHKNNGNIGMKNVTGNETLAARIRGENSTSLYPHVHILNNPILSSPNITEAQGNKEMILMCFFLHEMLP